MSVEDADAALFAKLEGLEEYVALKARVKKLEAKIARVEKLVANLGLGVGGQRMRGPIEICNMICEALQGVEE